MERLANVRVVAIGLGLLALVGLASALIAWQAATDRSDRIDELTNDVEALGAERDQLAVEVARIESGRDVIESRWLAAVAVGGSYSPSESRLLAVEAVTRSPTPESVAALGRLLFADPRTDPPIVELQHDGPVWVTAAASSTDAVATGSDDTTAKVWSTAGELLTALDHRAEVRAADFSGDDRRIATGTADGTVAIWTTAGEAVTSVTHGDQVNDVAISADGAITISGGADGAALVADAETGEVRHRLEHPEAVLTVTISDDERAATGAQDGLARVWDLETGAEVAAHDLGQPVTVVEFSPDGRWLFAGGHGTTAILVDADGGEASPPLEGAFRGGVVDIGWHPDGTELAVVSLGGVNRYELPARTLIAEHRPAGGSRGVAYGPDGSWFATGSGDFQFNFGEITFWDTSSGTELAGLNLGGPVESISVHPSGAVLAGYRTTEDLIEIGGAWLVPGPEDWTALACEGTDGVISEQTWSQLTGETTSLETDCP